jgi:hypothetical protein
MQAPTWLPYRLRSRWDQMRIDRALRGLERTAPLSASAAADADAEIYMLLCRRDVRLGVLALKSLLRFREARFAVTLTDDGTVGAARRQWIDRHVENSRWLPRFGEQPALQDAFQVRPHLHALYGSRFHMICKLLYPVVLPRCDRVLLLDSDTAFFRRPETVLDWACGRAPYAYYLHDVPEKEKTVPERVKETLRGIAERARPDGYRWSLDFYFFNAGLLLFRPADYDLDIAEAYLAWRSEAPERLFQGMQAIWFGDWTREQTCHLLTFATMAYPVRPLGEEYHLGACTETVFNHFMRDYVVQSHTLRRLQRLIEELE